MHKIILKSLRPFTDIMKKESLKTFQERRIEKTWAARQDQFHHIMKASILKEFQNHAQKVGEGCLDSPACQPMEENQ